MRKIGSTTSVAMAIVFAFSVFFTLSTQTIFAGDTYDWKLQSVWRTPATQNGLKLFAQNVKKASNGEINIKVYAANELVKIRATRSWAFRGLRYQADRSDKGFRFL